MTSCDKCGQQKYMTAANTTTGGLGQCKGMGIEAKVHKFYEEINSSDGSWRVSMHV
jgi:hypothetical protein